MDNRFTLLSRHFFVSHFLLQHRVCVLPLQNYICQIFGGVYNLLGGMVGGHISWSPPPGWWSISSLGGMVGGHTLVSSPGLVEYIIFWGGWWGDIPWSPPPGWWSISSLGWWGDIPWSPPPGSYICIV